MKAFTVSFQGLKKKPRTKRAPAAIRTVKGAMKKNLRASEQQIVLDPEVNELLWEKGIKKIPKKMRVEVFEKEGLFTVYLKGSEKLKERLKEEEKRKKKKEEKEKAKKEGKEKKENEKEEADKEIEKKKKEKKVKEKMAEAAAIKRKTAK